MIIDGAKIFLQISKIDRDVFDINYNILKNLIFIFSSISSYYPVCIIKVFIKYIN